MQITRNIPLAALATVVAAAFGSAAIAGPGTGSGGPAQQLLEAFDRIDTDGNGQLSKAEIEAARQARFKAADTDGDGALSQAELTALLEKEAAARAARMMARRDANGDGKLSPEEMGPAAGVTQGMRAKMFARIDTDGNGELSKAEIEAAVKAMGRDGRHKGKHSKGKRGQGQGQGGAN